MSVSVGSSKLQSDYMIHIFESSGTFTPNFTGTVEVLVVGGGGGGGMDMGGGGGGGGVVYNSGYSVSAGVPISVSVGAGGKGAAAGGTEGNPTAHQFSVSATGGGNSIFGSITAYGGGYGASSYWGYTPNYGVGGTGASGGGASGYSNGSSGSGGGSATQGYRGGHCGGQYYSGGGGGAGGPGADGPSQANGGPGLACDILGYRLYWGGGGGGAAYSLGTGGNGGIGGGGGGAIGTTTGGAGYSNGYPGGGGAPNSWAQCPGGNGGNGTGGGGGGGSHYNQNNKGGNGGSGIVIIKYLKSHGSATAVGTNLANNKLNLAFSYDMSNPKSWRGKPIDNLIALDGSDCAIERSGTGYPYWMTNITSYVLSRWSTQNNQLTMSFEGKRDYSVGGMGGGGDGYPCGYIYFHDWSWAVAGGPSGYNWEQYSTTFTMPNPTGKTIYWAIYHMENGNPGKSYSRNHQVEFSSFKTPFVNGSRGTSTSLMDISTYQTITLNNISYNSDNTFDVVGSNNGAINSAFYTNTNSTSRSWEVVVNPNTNFSTAGLFGHVLTEGCTYYCNGGICIWDGYYQYCWYDNAAYQFLNSGVVASKGVWFHIIATYNGSDQKCRIYVNGVLRNTSGATNNNYGGGTNNWQIGYLSDSGNSFNGKLAVTKYYYNKCLSDIEVSQSFTSLNSRFDLLTTTIIGSKTTETITYNNKTWTLVWTLDASGSILSLSRPTSIGKTMIGGNAITFHELTSWNSNWSEVMFTSKFNSSVKWIFKRSDNSSNLPTIIKCFLDGGNPSNHLTINGSYPITLDLTQSSAPNSGSNPYQFMHNNGGSEPCDVPTFGNNGGYVWSTGMYWGCIDAVSNYGGLLNQTVAHSGPSGGNTGDTLLIYIR